MNFVDKKLKIKFFNQNLQRKKTIELELVAGQQINIYVCGPTVYDHIHIGNLRSVIVFDTLISLFIHLGLKVFYVHNITDIDDKIIIKAEKEKKSEQKISDYYTKTYLANLTHYNIRFADHFPRVTQHLEQIQQFIANLIDKKAAYQKEGEVFFDVRQCKEYGRLSGHNLTSLKTLRDINIENKLNIQDFVLWKKTDKGVKWSSPWGEGRPGWHTECVAFIQHYFKGQTITIHGGGNDLQFPHHENERAQYLAHNKCELSQIWLHTNHIYLQKEKMSKSLDNVVLAEDFYNKYGSNVLRYLVLSVHYRQVINIGEELIQQSISYLQKIKNLLKRIKFYFYINKLNFDNSCEIKDSTYNLVINSLLDNFNTVKVFFYLEQIISVLNNNITRKKADKNFLQRIKTLYFILNILGLKFDLPVYDSATTNLIEDWLIYQNKKQYHQADYIRQKLQDNDVL